MSEDKKTEPADAGPETAGDKKDPAVKINREKYSTCRTATGAKSLNNGDEVANALEGLDVNDLYGIADKLFKDNDFRAKYSHLNTGMQRMNLGNRIRGFVSKRDAEIEKVIESNDRVQETGEGKATSVKKAGIEALKTLTDPLQSKARKAAEKAAKAKKTEDKGDSKAA